MSIAVVVAGALGLACGPRGPVSVDLSKYSRACQADSDCATVSTVKCPTCPPCGGAVVAASEVEKIEREYDALRCRESSERPPCAPCGAPTQVACVEGTCQSVPFGGAGSGRDDAP